jgi:cytochrome b
MNETENPAKPFVLWDWPTRLFHWLLVACVGLAWWSGEQADFERHSFVGYTVIVMVAFRITWGFIGSKHSRFSDFVVGPARVRDYVRGSEGHSNGHNPLGGWSVLVLLSLLLLQAFSGLFNTDDLLFDGPFYFWAEVGFRDAMGVVHEQTFYLLMAFITLHLVAVAYAQWRKRQPLVQAMVKGWAEGRTGLTAPRPGWWAMLIIAAWALLLWWTIGQAPTPQVMW